MGFSLARALAGAIAGGAGAAASIADANIKEAAASREREAQFERQRQLMREQDEIIAAREQRVADTKLKLENARRKEVSNFMNVQLDALSERGIDPGSVQGQRMLASAAARAGYQDYADKFYDNAYKQLQLNSEEARAAAQLAATKEMREMALAESRARREESRARREADTDAKISDREKATWKDISSTVDSFELQTYDREGHKGEVDGTAKTEAMRMVRQMQDKDVPATKILDNVLKFKSQFDEIRTDPQMKGARGVQLFDATAKFINTEVAKTKEASQPKPAQPPSAPAAQPSAPAGATGSWEESPAPVPAARPQSASTSFFSHEGPGFTKSEPYVNKFVPTPQPDRPDFLDQISGGVTYGDVGSARPRSVFNR